MEDIHNWYRIIGIYIALHIILFFIEGYKYKNSTFSWHGFKENGMYAITYLLIFFDKLLIIGAILIWAIWPLVKEV